MPAAVARTAGVERVDAVRVDVPDKLSRVICNLFFFELIICKDDTTHQALIKRFKGLWETRGCTLRGAASSGGTACHASPEGGCPLAAGIRALQQLANPIRGRAVY